MGTVIYSMSVSLDGFIAGPSGEIDWAAPDEELMRFHNEQTRELGAHLCGRGLYENMLPWEVAEETRSDPQQLEFARIWKAIPKVVFSTTLEKVEGNARLAKGGVVDEVVKLKERSEKPVAVGGAGFASTLVELDLITSTGCSSVRSCWVAAPRTFQLWTSGSTSSWSRRGHSALASSTSAIGVSAPT